MSREILIYGFYEASFWIWTLLLLWLLALLLPLIPGQIRQPGRQDVAIVVVLPPVSVCLLATSFGCG